MLSGFLILIRTCPLAFKLFDVVNSSGDVFRFLNLFDSLYGEATIET